MSYIATPEVDTLINASMGKLPLDLLLRNSTLVNVVTAETYPADIGIYGGRIAYVGPATGALPQSRRQFNLRGKCVAPGLIDTHLHVESSMLTPPRFAEAVVPHGTTTVAIDPHEIANVLGIEGVRMMLDASLSLPLRFHLLVPTCVPSLPGFETTGGKIEFPDVEEMLSWPEAIGLGEVMDYDGMIHLNPRTMGIVRVGLSRNVVIDGHAPGLTGRELSAYFAGGVEADHEVTNSAEVLERLRLGAFVKLRRSALTLEVIRRLTTLRDKRNVLLVTDDILPDSLMKNGHLDNVVRSAVECGYEPLEAIQAVTINAARHVRLYDRGQISPGKLADIVVFSSLRQFHVDMVIQAGRVVAQEGKLTKAQHYYQFPERACNTIKLESPPPGRFLVKAPLTSGQVRVRVIVTGDFETHFEERAFTVENGIVLPGDLATIMVFDRYTGEGMAAQGFIDGLGIKSGAVAATVSHDAHNLIVVGRSPSDMALAARTVIDLQGGLAAAEGGLLNAVVPLPISGLMSQEKAESLAGKVEEFKEAQQLFGLRVLPLGGWLGISFLALPVIPHARITDKGLFDVDRRRVVPMFLTP